MAIGHFAFGAAMTTPLVMILVPTVRYARTSVLLGGGWAMLPDFHWASPVASQQLRAIHRTLAEADHDLLILCNFGDGTPTFEAPESLDTDDATVVLANREDPAADPAAVELRPYEAAIYRLF